MKKAQNKKKGQILNFFQPKVPPPHQNNLKYLRLYFLSIAHFNLMCLIPSTI